MGRDPGDLDAGDYRDLDEAAVEVRPERLQAGEVERLVPAPAVGIRRPPRGIPGSELLLEGQELADPLAHDVEEEVERPVPGPLPLAPSI